MLVGPSTGNAVAPYPVSGFRLLVPSVTALTVSRKISCNQLRLPFSKCKSIYC